MRPVRILFFSSSPISLPLLKTLSEDLRFEVQAVFCQPDRPAGRGQNLMAPPSKLLAQKYGIPVFQPVRLKDATDLLERFSGERAPDFLLTFAYGQILSEAWLALPLKMPINIHGSLLPLYRGASPIQSVLLDGALETGLSLMKMEKAMDAGPVARRWPLNIPVHFTADDLFDALAHLAVEQVPSALLELARLTPLGLGAAFEEQKGEASFCGKLTKEQGFEDFLRDSAGLMRRYRAFTSWPSLWTFWRGKRLKLLSLRVTSDVSLQPGMLRAQNGHLYVGTQDLAVEILTLQLEGKSKMSAEEFLRGQVLTQDDHLGH